MPARAYLLYTPALRSSHLERLRPLADLRLELLAGGRHRDLDRALLADPPVPVTFAEGPALDAVVAARRPAVLEVTEPLWAPEWATSVRLAAVARAADPGVVVAGYAIETLVPDGPPPPVAGVLDAVVHGSDATRVLYERCYGAGALGAATVLEERRGRCARCFPDPVATAPARREVAFVAEFGDRKGIDLLLDAWPEVAAPGWRLRLLGYGPRTAEVLAWAAGRGDVDVEVRAGRAAVHDALRRAAVVVLPSRRVPGWREQAGLSLVEGLAHGCRLVTTTETGLAAGLVAAGHDVVRPGSASDLAEGLRRALAAAPSAKALPPADEDSRMAATRWIAARATGTPAA